MAQERKPIADTGWIVQFRPVMDPPPIDPSHVLLDVALKMVAAREPEPGKAEWLDLTTFQKRPLNTIKQKFLKRFRSGLLVAFADTHQLLMSMEPSGEMSHRMRVTELQVPVPKEAFSEGELNWECSFVHILNPVPMRFDVYTEQGGPVQMYITFKRMTIAKAQLYSNFSELKKRGRGRPAVFDWPETRREIGAWPLEKRTFEAVERMEKWGRLGRCPSRQQIKRECGDLLYKSRK
jgi:hypothetical protein